MSETTLTWTVANMITITIMAVVGFAIIGVVGQLIRRNTGAG